MYKDLIINKLKQLNLKFTWTSSNYIMTTCFNQKHNDTHPSFSINTDNGFGFCFTCGYKIKKEYWGKIDETLVRENKLNELLAKLKVKQNNNEYKEVLLPPKINKSLQEILGGTYRGISIKLLEKLGCYYCDSGKYKNRIIFPIYEKIKAIGFTSRDITNKSKLKYIHSKGFDSKSFIFGYDYLKKLNKNYVILTEGIFDSLSLLELGIPSTPNWGVSFNINEIKIKYFLELGIDTIYLMFDKDVAGIKGTEQFLKNKSLNDIFDVKFVNKLNKPIINDYLKSNVKDFNEFYQGIKGCNNESPLKFF